MTFESARQLVCPYNGINCIVNKCMFWVTTANGKKEISRVLEPYDMTPGEISNWISRKKAEGYVEEKQADGKWRDVYVKYEEAYEGYCIHTNRKDINGTDK